MTSKASPKFCALSGLLGGAAGPQEPQRGWRGRGLHPLVRGTWTAGSPRQTPPLDLPEHAREVPREAGGSRQRPARVRARSLRKKEHRRRYRLSAYFQACVAGLFRLV